MQRASTHLLSRLKYHLLANYKGEVARARGRGAQSSQLRTKRVAVSLLCSAIEELRLLTL